MRSNDIFARMTPKRAEAFLAELRRDAPPIAQLALAAAAGAFKLRPVFIRKQPRAKQAEWMRKALARGTMATTAEEILAQYFLEHRRTLLVEWLDQLGLEHEEGVLTGDTPECPSEETLRKAVDEFRSDQDSEQRELLLQAFAAQSAIDWAPLEKLIEV